MALDKAIEHKKEKRKQYTGGKAIDKRCRNHGGCEWCEGNRLHQRNKSERAADESMKEYEEWINERSSTL